MLPSLCYNYDNIVGQVSLRIICFSTSDIELGRLQRYCDQFSGADNGNQIFRGPVDRDANTSSLIIVYPGRKLWGFPRFAGDCASGHRRSHSGTSSEQKFDITDSCSQMILQLHDVYDPNKVSISIYVSMFDVIIDNPS